MQKPLNSCEHRSIQTSGLSNSENNFLSNFETSVVVHTSYPNSIPQVNSWTNLHFYGVGQFLQYMDIFEADFSLPLLLVPMAQCFECQHPYCMSHWNAVNKKIQVDYADTNV